MTQLILDTDYRVTKIKSKPRIFGGRFGNEFGGTPWITLDEEILTYDSVTGALYHNPCGQLKAELVDPSEPLELRSPSDDTVIDTSTYMDVMIMIYSLGRHLQLKRDAALAAQSEIEANNV